METVIIDSIPFSINEDNLLAGLKIKSGTSIANRVMALAKNAIDVIRPKAVYRIVPIREVGDNHVCLDNEKLISRIMAVNLRHAPSVAVYAATCGTEIDIYADALENALEKYCLEFIMIMAVVTAEQVLEKKLKEKFPGNDLSSMKPGSLDDWPITAQENIFRLLRGGAEGIGIHLNDSFLMKPLKSLSGIYFPSIEHYENCQLCPRDKCPGRKVEFDPELYDKKYR